MKGWVRNRNEQMSKDKQQKKLARKGKKKGISADVWMTRNDNGCERCMV